MVAAAARGLSPVVVNYEAAWRRFLYVQVASTGSAGEVKPPALSLLHDLLSMELLLLHALRRNWLVARGGLGLQLDATNRVTMITPGSQAARDGKLRVDDLILAIDGERLGRKPLAHAVANLKGKSQFSLTVSRRGADGGGAV